MGRSVSFANDSVQVEYASFERADEFDDYGFDDGINYLQEVATERYPSLSPCDTWLGSEDHAILENDHAYVGVSEYCGLVSVWVVAKAHKYTGAESGIAKHWCEQINLKPLAECFGTRLNSRGTFSNGEQIFSAAIPAQTKGEMGLGFTSKCGWL